jgi:hypothetical protein
VDTPEAGPEHAGVGEEGWSKPLTIGRLEKGRRPAQLETVRKLAEALDVEVEELLVRK